MVEKNSKPRVIEGFNCPSSELWRVLHFPKMSQMGAWSINKLLFTYPSSMSAPI